MTSNLNSKAPQGSDIPPPSFNPLSKKGKEITPRLEEALQVMDERKERMTDAIDHGKKPDVSEINRSIETTGATDSPTTGGARA